MNEVIITVDENLSQTAKDAAVQVIAILEELRGSDFSLLSELLKKGGYNGTAKDLEQLIVTTLSGGPKGSIVPSSIPSGTGSSSWLATQAGTYTNFGGVVVNANSFAVISRNDAGAFSISQTPLDISSKVNVSDVQNNLTSTEILKPLSAAQGKILNDTKLDANVITERKNILNPDLFQSGQFFTDGDGSLGTDPNACNSGKQKVLPNTSYSFSSNLGAYSRIEFDVNGIFVSRVSGSNNVSFTTSATTYYIGISWLSGNVEGNFILIKNNTIVNKGALRSYVSYSEMILKQDAVDFSANIINNLTSNETTKSLSASQGKILNDTKLNNSDVFERKNILNPDLFQSGQFFTDGDGSLGTDPNACNSGKQKVLPNTSYSFSSNLGAYSRIEFDVNGIFVSRVSGSNNVSFTTSATTYYIGISWLSGNVGGNFILIKNNTIVNKGGAMAYVPYSEMSLTDTFTNSEIITIANSDKIGVVGNSYTNGYSMKGKNYLNILSMWSDYQFRNFGKDGDDLPKIIARINANETRVGVVPIKSWGMTYCVIADRDNNLPDDVKAYYNNTKKLCEIIENLGAIPILSTEHQIQSGMNWFGAFERLQREKGYMFMSWGHQANVLNGAYFEPFWYARHPATRTMWLWANGFQKYIRTLPRPKKGIKLFRVRSMVDSTNINNLVYTDNHTRADKFNEIAIGQRAITMATEKYFDRMNNAGVLFEDVFDEYQNLQNKIAVSFGSFALLEVILPYTFKDTRSCVISFSGTGITNAYIKKTINSVDSFIEVPIVNNAISIFDFANAMMYDKLAILFKGTNISISDISAKAVGTAYKTQITKPLMVKKSGIDMLTDNLLDAGTSWTNLANVPIVTKVINPLKTTETEIFPRNVNTVREITNTVFLTQSLKVMAIEDFYSLNVPRVQVRVLARYFPDYVDTDLKFDTTVIKTDSIDTADLELSLKGTGLVDTVPFAVEKIGLDWHEVVVETILSDFTSILNLKCISSGKKIQIGKVEVIKLINY